MTNNDPNVSTHQALTAGLRHEQPSWANLQQVWPDIHRSLAEIDEGIANGKISTGALDWTEQAQLDHYQELGSNLHRLGADLDQLARNWTDNGDGR